MPPPNLLEVALPLPLRRLFTYALPEHFSRDAASLIGCRVKVPFGRKGTLMGYAVAAPEETSLPPESLKPVAEILDEEPVFSPAMLAFTKWTADYYAASWGEVLRAAHPASLHARERRRWALSEAGAAALAGGAKLAEPLRRILEQARVQPLGPGALRALKISPSSARLRRLVEKGWLVESREFIQPGGGKRAMFVEMIAEPEEGMKITAREQAALAYLRERGGKAPAAELADVSASPHALARQMRRKGLIRIFAGRAMRDPFWDKPPETPPAEFSLTPGQKKALAALEPLVEKPAFRPVLLHGVTGSGKTEVYIRLIRRVLEAGRRALYLVPEIGLTPQTAARLRGHFGGAVAILHSGLGAGERFDQWERIRRGEASLVVGTRSAVFAPLDNIGLIVVDEEHDASYKQEESPYYHARDLALLRGREEGAPVILGSATPSAESYYNACGPALEAAYRPKRREPYLYLSMPERVTRRPMPEMELVDMAAEFRETGEREPFSRRLREALRECLARGEQAMLLLNRRGYAPFVLCRDCGHAPECPHCSVSLTLHLPKGTPRTKDALVPAGAAGYLLCHYCGQRAGMPRRCAQCGGEFVQMVGFGTAQVEHEVRRWFPEARTLRLDRDTAATKDAHHRILSDFSARRADVLVGTQMIAKGHDFPEVTLAGVISADTGLGFPDFRAAERTFHLLTQVAGRAGRAGKPGRVVLQSLSPKHYAVDCACRYDESGFYAKEMWFRRIAKYPPFVAMAVVLVRHKDEKQGAGLIRRIARALHEAGDAKVAIAGPAPAPMAKLKDVYRFQIILKAEARGRLRAVLERAFSSLKRYNAEAVKVNIDPINLL